MFLRHSGLIFSSAPPINIAICIICGSLYIIKIYGGYMFYKLLTISTLLALFPVVGMQKPAAKKKTMPLQVDVTVINYVTKLGRFETELNKLIDSATDYENADLRLMNTINANTFLKAKDRIELYAITRQKLGEKFLAH